MRTIARKGAQVALILAGAAAQAQTLTGEDIKSSWVGKEVVGRAPNGSRVVMTLNADGTAKLLIGAVPDPGTWRPVESGYCATWQGLRAGQEACFTVKREADNRYQIIRADGTSSTVELR